MKAVWKLLENEQSMYVDSFYETLAFQQIVVLLVGSSGSKLRLRE